MSAQTRYATTASLPARTRRLCGAAIGLLTAAFALGVAEVLASFIDDQASPLVAVGNAAIDATPEWLKDFAIRSFGANDKRALMIGMVAVIAVLAVVLGIISMRRPRVGLYGLMVLGAVGAIAALNRPTGSVLSVIPSIGGALAGEVRGGFIVSMVLGFIGTLVGPWIAHQLKLPEPFVVNISGQSFPVLWSIIGAAVFVALIHLISSRR